MDTNLFFYEKLKSLIADNVLKLKGDEIDQLYSFWATNIEKPTLKNLLLPSSVIHANQQVADQSTLKGVDLPSWFGNINNPKIVVLGIDPLREKNDFIRSDCHDYDSNVLIGTPYAFHEKAARDGYCRSYWTLVDGLVKAERFVYCTDIFKTYYYNKKKSLRSYLDQEFIKNKNHRDLLMKELNLIKPDFIIVFGKMAHELLFRSRCPKIGQNVQITKKKFELNDRSVEVYTVLHLSKTPRGAAFKTFFTANDLSQQDVNYENRVQCAELYLELLKKQGVC